MEKKKMTVAQKTLLILVIIIASVAIILLGVRLFFRLPVKNYYNNSVKAFVIPDINGGFVPQGIDYDAATQNFFVTGYYMGSSASPIYMVSRADGKTVKRVYLNNADGTPYKGHSGGVAVYGDYVYLASGSLYVFGYSDIIAAENNGSVTCLGKFDAIEDPDNGLGAAFVTVNDNKLIIGEFYREKNYPTPASHKITTSGGDYCQAIALSFQLDHASPLGLKNVPDAAYTLPDLAQGMCIVGDEIYVSTSYGMAFSNVKVYSYERATGTAQFNFLGNTIPLYELQSASLIKNVKIAPMSEELTYVDGKIYVMCESASNKYIFGKFTSAKWCYATDFSKL